MSEAESPPDRLAAALWEADRHVAALESALADGDVACVLMEPALTNIGIVLPKPGYLDEVRRLTRSTGTLLVIDETHTICAGPGHNTADTPVMGIQ